jgi:hypothetical protein
MKTTSRLLPKNGTKRPSPQVQPADAAVKYPAVKSPYGADFDLEAGNPENLCLVLFDREGQEPVQRIPLTEKEMATLCKAKSPLQPNRETAEIVADAVREKLGPHGLGGIGRVALSDELANAKAQSAALHQLLSLAVNRGDGGDPFGEELTLGMYELQWVTSDRLDRVYDAVSALELEAHNLRSQIAQRPEVVK